jgi:ABC-2 type transport system permease protein
MSFSRIFSIIKRETRLGFRNPIFLFAIIIPFVLTAIVQLVFGDLLSQKPVLAVYDRTDGVVAAELEKNRAITLVEAGSEEELRLLVETKQADMGVVFPEDIRRLLARDAAFSLRAYVDGEAYARDRALTAAATVAALRELAPETQRVDFEQVRLGEERPVTIIDLMIPFLVLLAVLYSAFLLPSTFLVREKERKTIVALLVTPVSRAEVLTAYGLLGGVLAVLMGVIVLILNGAWTQPLLMILFLALGAVFMVEIGLIAGLYFNDMNTLFANIKLFGIVLFGPALLIFFPDWPQWIGRLFPTYYLIHPVYRISIFGDSFARVGWEAAALFGFIAVFFIPVVILSKRLTRA